MSKSRARSLRPVLPAAGMLCLLTLFSLPLVGQATPPSADTFVSSANPRTNFGSSIILVVQSGASSYLQFNLSTLPPGASVNKATLRLYVDAVSKSGSFDVYQLNAGWNENTLTFNTPPPVLGASATGGKPVSISSSSLNQFLLIDITPLVQGWVNGTISNNGVALALTNGSSASFSIDAKESLLTGNGPELEIVLNGPAGPQGPQGIQGPQGPQGVQGPPGPVLPDLVYTDQNNTFTSNQILQGNLLLAPTGIATGIQGFNSYPFDLQASAFDGAKPQRQTFRWQAEPTGNNTPTASGTLNLLFGGGNGATPAETGLSVNANGALNLNSIASPGVLSINPGTDLLLGVPHDFTLHMVHDFTMTTDNNNTQAVHGSLTSTVDKELTQTIHGNFTTTTDKNKTETVHGTATTQIDVDSVQTINGNLSTTVAQDTTQLIHGGLTTTVDRDRTETTHGNLTSTVDKDLTETVHGNLTTTTDKNKVEIIHGSAATSIDQDNSQTIAGVLALTTGKDVNVSAGAGISMQAGSNLQVVSTQDTSLTSGGNLTMAIGKATTLQSGTDLGFSSGQDTTLQAGKSLEVSAAQAANVTAGTDISLTSGHDLNLTSDSNTKLRAAGGMTLEASGIIEIKASLVQVDGLLSKGGGTFQIDHPLDPLNKYLYHSFVESPDMMNVYNGNVTTNKYGVATIILPDYFEALNRDFRYQLTVIGQFSQAIVARKIRNNRFVIKTTRPQVEVSWQVTGIRQDPFANLHRIQVEEQKPQEARGHYLHPDAYEKERATVAAVPVR